MFPFLSLCHQHTQNQSCFPFSCCSGWEWRSTLRGTWTLQTYLKARWRIYMGRIYFVSDTLFNLVPPVAKQLEWRELYEIRSLSLFFSRKWSWGVLNRLKILSRGLLRFPTIENSILRNFDQNRLLGPFQPKLPLAKAILGSQARHWAATLE